MVTCNIYGNICYGNFYGNIYGNFYGNNLKFKNIPERAIFFANQKDSNFVDSK